MQPTIPIHGLHVTRTSENLNSSTLWLPINLNYSTSVCLFASPVFWVNQGRGIPQLPFGFGLRNSLPFPASRSFSHPLPLLVSPLSLAVDWDEFTILTPML